MFEDSLIESGNKLKTKRLATSIVSFFGQFLLLGILILIPLIYTEALPKTQLMTFLVAPRWSRFRAMWSMASCARPPRFQKKSR